MPKKKKWRKKSLVGSTPVPPVALLYSTYLSPHLSDKVGQHWSTESDIVCGLNTFIKLYPQFSRK